MDFYNFFEGPVEPKIWLFIYYTGHGHKPTFLKPLFSVQFQKAELRVILGYFSTAIRVIFSRNLSLGF